MCRVPMAPHLVELELFRYVESGRTEGYEVPLPTLGKDGHGKLPYLM